MNYCEIFRTGTHTSANGYVKEWNIDDLNKIVDQFNENKLPVPIVIGHPKSNNPAYGWVDTLKIEGEKLLATFKQVNEEFAEWVNKGLYKNRSISLYPNLQLRHIGFLGAVPPAVKGLAEFQFEEQKEYEEYVLNCDVVGRNNQACSSNSSAAQSDFSSNDKEREVKKVELEELKKQNEEFSEKLSEKDRKILELEDKLTKQQAEKRMAEHEQFAEEMVKEGCITPAQKPYVVDFMEVCTNQGSYDFAEGEEKDCLTVFKTLLRGMKQIDFSEIANKDNAAKKSDTIDFNDGQSIAKAIQKRKAEYLKEGIEVAENVILEELKKGDK